MTGAGPYWDQLQSVVIAAGVVTRVMFAASKYPLPIMEWQLGSADARSVNGRQVGHSLEPLCLGNWGPAKGKGHSLQNVLGGNDWGTSSGRRVACTAGKDGRVCQGRCDDA